MSDRIALVSARTPCQAEDGEDSAAEGVEGVAEMEDEEDEVLICKSMPCCTYI